MSLKCLKMADEFCTPCKPSTKAKCASCPRGNVDLVALYRSQGQVAPSKMTDYPSLRFMAADYLRCDYVYMLVMAIICMNEIEEEHF